MLNEPIIINFGPSYCTLHNASEGIEEILYEELKYQPDGYFFSPLYQAEKWDGWNRMYYPKTKRFRVGMLSRAYHTLISRGFNVRIDNKPLPKPTFMYSVEYMLRGYQYEAAQACTTHRFGIVKAPPRSGKTQIFLAVADSEREFPTIFLVRSKDLAYQTKDRAGVFLPDVSCGMVGDGVCDIKDITIITFQSAFSAFDKKYDLKKKAPDEKDIANVEDKLLIRNLILSAKVVFVDECHHMVSATSKFILEKCNSATMKIGLSATPFGDKKNAITVEERLGTIIYSIGYGKLIKDGYILRPDIYMYKLPKMPGVEGNYQSIYKQSVVENEFLNALIVKIVDKLVSLGKSIVIQTEYKAHTRNVAKMLGCEFLYGDDKTEKRIDIKDKLNNKEILVLVSTLFEEGLDVPSLDYTINLVGGLESIGILQRMRSMTASDGKESCGIIDFIHQTKYLSKHSRKRKKLYSSEPEFRVHIRDVSNKAIEEVV